MGALQEARFYVIIWVIMLIGILGYFFTLQNNVGYTDYSTALKTTYADIKANASATKTLKDVVTIDGTSFRQMKNNQLFGLTLNGNADAIKVFDNFTTSITPHATTFVNPGSGKINVSFLLSDVSANINDAAVWTGTPTNIDTLAEMWTYNSTVPSERGWTLDTSGYIGYTFPDVNTAKDVMNNYLPNGTLMWQTVVVPFTSK